jgi:hypothetical protein
MEGYAVGSPQGRIGTSAILGGEVQRMLQWKPKAIGLVSIVVLVAAVSGQFTWDSFVQFTWF